VCDYEVNVDCAASERFYVFNENFGKIQAKEDQEILDELDDEENTYLPPENRY